MKKFMFFFALLFNASLFAIVRPCPGQFTVTGEWVYLDPIIDNPYFVVDKTVIETNDQEGPRKANELCFESGFRVEAMYAFCDCLSDIRVAWTYLSSDHKRTISGPALAPTAGHPNINFISSGESEYSGDAISKIDFDFNRAEAVFGFHVFNCRRLGLVLEAGVQYSCFDVKNDIHYVGTAPETITDTTPTVPVNILVESESCYWGVGPQVGFDFNYCICGNFSFVGLANYALLIGENETKSFLSNPRLIGVGVDVKNDRLWRIVPSYQIRAGLNYGCQLFCMNWNIEAGYQFLAYIRALDTVEWVNEVQVGRSLDIYSNADLHGPYAALSLTF